MFASVFGFLWLGFVYGVSLWSALLVLRHEQVIDDIISYRWCCVLGYIFVAIRIYDKALVGKR